MLKPDNDVTTPSVDSQLRNVLKTHTCSYEGYVMRRTTMTLQRQKLLSNELWL